PTGAANYWPLWSDTTYFPSSRFYKPAGLNDAYHNLVVALKNLPHNNGLSDFANIIGGQVTDPATIQEYLDLAYQNAYPKNTLPKPPGGGTFPLTAPFPVEAATR